MYFNVNFCHQKMLLFITNDKIVICSFVSPSSYFINSIPTSLKQIVTFKRQSISYYWKPVFRIELFLTLYPKYIKKISVN